MFKLYIMALKYSNCLFTSLQNRLHAYLNPPKTSLEPMLLCPNIWSGKGTIINSDGEKKEVYNVIRFKKIPNVEYKMGFAYLTSQVDDKVRNLKCFWNAIESDDGLNVHVFHQKDDDKFDLRFTISHSKKTCNFTQTMECKKEVHKTRQYFIVVESMSEQPTGPETTMETYIETGSGSIGSVDICKQCERDTKTLAYLTYCKCCGENQDIQKCLKNIYFDPSQ
jgi:hypothetical protein